MNEPTKYLVRKFVLFIIYADVLFCFQKLFVLSCIFLICKSAVAQDDLFMTYRVSSDRFVQVNLYCILNNN